MGNNSSQPSDYEEGPQYRYHEAVLREAQNTAPPSMYLSEDEEHFYSAEEGDSSRSVTPERERPESSSGGEQNSNSDTDDETGSPEASRQTERRDIVTNEPSLGRSNVSIAQEHDSINHELEAIARGNASIGQEGCASANQKRALSTSSPQHQVLSKKFKAHTKSSPFQPICSGNRQQRLIRRLSETVPTVAKRKAKPDENEGDASPTKKALLEGGSKRVRLGYFDSSESENSGSDGRGRTRRKRAKLGKNVRNRHTSDLHSAGSSSEENQGTRFSNPSRGSIECDQSNSEVEGAENQCGKTYHHEGKLSQSSQNLDDTDLYRDSDAPKAPLSLRRGKLRDKILSKVQPGYGNHNVYLSSDKSPENRNSDNADYLVVYQSSNPSPPSNRSAMTNEASERNLSTKSDSEQTPEAMEERGKMGDHGFRNARGKVLPLHQVRTPVAPLSLRQPNSNNQTTKSRQNSLKTLHSTDHLNISDGSRRASGAFVSLQTVPSFNTQPNASPSKAEDTDTTTFVHLQKSDTVRCDHLQSAANKPYNSPFKGKSPPKGSSSPTKRSLSDNPFQDVELTPPSKQLHLSTSHQGVTNIDNVVSQDLMETDESHQDTDYSCASPQAETKTTSSDRPVLRAKRSLGKTVAERFRNFWTRKKIGSNLKSVFSKSPASSPKDYSLPPNNRAVKSFHHPSQDVLFSDKNDVDTSTPLTFPNSNRVQSNNLSLENQAAPSDQAFPSHMLPPGRQVDKQQAQHHLGSNTQFQPATREFENAVQTENQSGRRTSSRLLTQRSGHETTSVVKHLTKKSQFQAVSVQLGECLNVTVSLGSLADQTTEGLVNWTDGGLTHKVTKCSRAMAARAGALFTTGCQDYLENKDGPLEAPDVLITVAGGKFDSNVRAILHVVCPSPTGSPLTRRGNRQAKHRGLRDDEAAKSLLLQVYANCLRFAEGKLSLSSLALPLIGLGDFSIETCVQCFHDSLVLFLHEKGFPSDPAPSMALSSVHLIIPDAKTTDSAAELFESCLSGLSTVEAFSSAVSLLSGKYCFEPRDLKRHSSLSTESLPVSPLSGTGSEGEYRESQEKRTASGRPRVKRRRL